MKLACGIWKIRATNIIRNTEKTDQTKDLGNIKVDFSIIGCELNSTDSR
jgi:hypothetical protein